MNPRPKARRRGTLHAYPLLLSRAQREEAAKNRRVTSLGESRGPAPRRHGPTSLFNGVRPPATRRGQGERHSLIKLRERTDCPQLTDVPSDLRVNGARHASRDLEPPSKPNSPPLGSRRSKNGKLTLLSCRQTSVSGGQAWALMCHPAPDDK